MLKKVYERLISFGYTIPVEEEEYHPTALDEMMLTFIHDKEVSSVKGECNEDEVPEEIVMKVVDHIAGEFLMSKKNLGQLALDELDLSGAVKRLEIGDTKIEFAEGGSQAEMFDCLIAMLMKPIDFSDYRRIRW